MIKLGLGDFYPNSIPTGDVPNFGQIKKIRIFCLPTKNNFKGKLFRQTMYCLPNKSCLPTKNAKQIVFCWSKPLFWQQLFANSVKTKQTMCYMSKKK